MNWQDFYKVPFQKDDGCGEVITLHGKEKRYRMVWDWIENSNICEYPVRGEMGYELSNAIIKYVNGESDERPDFTWEASKTSPCEILMNGEPCIYIRGWGELTGIGGYGLSREEAAKIQDDFKEFLINKLNGTTK